MGTSVEGKTQESARLAQVVSDATSDREGVQEQLTAVLEYLDKLRPQCTTEPESYEERKARREHEIEGLKTALDILENETALVQVSSKKYLRKSQQALHNFFFENVSCCKCTIFYFLFVCV